MQLHEFMTERREEILRACDRELGEAAGEKVQEYIADFYDETVRAIRRDCGVPESRSPLPESSETAARFGATRQRAGVPITHVPVIFAAISQALGKTGQNYELSISAEEYRMLNRCLDAGLASSIENFWQRDKDREKKLITERFGFLAHELRNALGNANMAFKLLRGGGLPMTDHTADILGRNLARMEALVTQSLAGAQLEAGAAPILRPVRLASILAGLEASAIPERQIRIELQIEADVFVSADELLLTSAVGNLLHNALKFSRPGAVVRLRAHVRDENVFLEIADECGGLAPGTDLEKLVQPYVRSTDDNPTGTGLGLWIAARAIAAMHGELSVANQPGYGCVFSARFPLLVR